MSKAKYPKGTILRHKKTGIIVEVQSRYSHTVYLKVLRGDSKTITTKFAYMTVHHDDDGGYTLEYSPNSINRLFEDLGPAAHLLYAKT